MRVRNEMDAGVFVANYGVIPAGDEATVQQSEAVKQLIKVGALKEVTGSSGGSGGGSSDTDDKDGDG